MGKDNLIFIIDTNMLIIQVKEGIDLIDEIRSMFGGKKEIVILKDSIYELEKLKKKGIRWADIALEKVLKQKIKVLNVESDETDVDRKILKEAMKQNAFILTNDRELKDRAKGQGLRVISYNSSKHRLVVV